MLRRYQNAVLAVSAAMLVASVLGVQLGRSAVDEINPIHFRGPLPAPRAADPAAARPAPDAFASAYGWDAGNAARLADCGGNCDARDARQAFAAVLVSPRRPAPAPYWRDATPTEEPEPPPAGGTGETGDRPLSVERYMHYPVESAPEAG